MARIPSRGSDQFMVRFPPRMRDQIREQADANGRSMNAEIVARLERSAAQGESWEASEVVKRLVLALTSKDEDRRKAAQFEGLTFLADFPMESKQLMLAWEAIRPPGPARWRITPAQASDIEAMIDHMVEPEMEQVLNFLRQGGWTVLPPSGEVDADDIEKQIMDLTSSSRRLSHDTNSLEAGGKPWVRTVLRGLKDIQNRIEKLALSTVDNWHKGTVAQGQEEETDAGDADPS